MKAKDIAAAYQALPPGTTVMEAAKALGACKTTIVKVRRQLGVQAVNPCIPDHAKDRTLVAQYLALGVASTGAAAREFGVSHRRLKNALNRTGTPRISAPKPAAPTVDPWDDLGPSRSGGEALPPGHPITWGAICNQPYPR